MGDPTSTSPSTFQVDVPIRARDYANAMFLADFGQLLNTPRNRFLIIDFTVNMFNKLLRWAQPPVLPRQFSLNTINVNDRYQKFTSFAMRGIPGTYIKFQGLMDVVYTYANPLLGYDFNSVNYNYVSDQAGLYTLYFGAPVYPANIIATDGTNLGAFAGSTDQEWETAWNTILRPYENSIHAQYKGRYNNELTFPSGDWPYIRHTATPGLFRLSPDQPNVSLIFTLESTGEKNRAVAPAPRGPFISPARMTPFPHINV